MLSMSPHGQSYDLLQPEIWEFRALESLPMLSIKPQCLPQLSSLYMYSMYIIKLQSIEIREYRGSEFGEQKGDLETRKR